MTPREQKLLDALRECVTDHGAVGYKRVVSFGQIRLDAITKTAQDAIAEAEKPREKSPHDWVCDTCGNDDIQGTAWVYVNTDELTNDEPPTSYYYCEDCEDAEVRVCQRSEFEAAQAVEKSIEGSRSEPAAGAA